MLTKIKQTKVVGKVADLFSAFFHSGKIAGLLLVFCAAISLTLANTYLGGESYRHIAEKHLDLSVGFLQLNYSIEEWINDGLMAIFFLMVGLEVERELYVGELADVRRAILPLTAAIGGIVVPSLIHFFLNKGTETQSGFAIPMATDIAFALGILALAGNRVPMAVKVFLSALAITDDIGAIVVIALFYTKTILFTYLLVALGILAVLFVFNRMKINNLLLYLLPGVIIWYCFLKSGVHATIAGVLLAFVLPFDEADPNNISNKLLRWLHKPVSFIIIPLFALVNTAIKIPADLLGSLNNTNSAGIILGLLVGKAVGIFSVPFILVKLGLARFQKGITYKNLLGIGLLGGIGFTMSMFISNLAFTNDDFVITSKLSILIASTASALIGLLVFSTNRRIKYKQVTGAE